MGNSIFNMLFLLILKIKYNNNLNHQPAVNKLFCDDTCKVFYCCNSCTHPLNPIHPSGFSLGSWPVGGWDRVQKSPLPPSPSPQIWTQVWGEGGRIYEPCPIPPLARTQGRSLRGAISTSPASHHNAMPSCHAPWCGGGGGGGGRVSHPQ